VLVLALVLATIAWFYARTSDRRAQQAWGAERAALVVMAPRAELWVLSADNADPGNTRPVDKASDDTRIDVDGHALSIVQRHNISAARGVLHLRRGLIDDTSFDWDRADDECGPQWTHALSFADGDEVVTLLVSLDCPRVRLAETGQELSTRPIAGAVREFVAEQVGAGVIGER
jgi:hypothetical protein